jgi:acetate kinase
MKILTFNCGSSSLKCKLFEVDRGTGSSSERVLGAVVVERIGGASAIRVSAADKHTFAGNAAVADHDAAVEAAADALETVLPGWREGLGGVGHRVVHGGERFREPALLDDDALEALDALGEMAPLHNGPALAAIRRSRVLLSTRLPMVAAFDTAFHRSMPGYAARYAISHELTSKHAIYRYGFHGLAHRSMVEQLAGLSGNEGAGRRAITLQLGNGCSIAAVRGSRCLDTSMGFTPLEGLMMGTRSGDIDPAVVTFLARQATVAVDEVERWLNTRSGLMGVSGRSADVRDLLHAESEGDERASLALDMFCYRARKYLGAYMAVLGGADAILFGGGIGENAPQIRARICSGMEWTGLRLDEARNQALVGAGGQISADNSTIQAYVCAVDEERLIARDTFDLVQAGS